MPNGEADLTPNGVWRVARTATVNVKGGVPLPNIPIIQVLVTGAAITIRKNQFPNGVVILNELPRPNHNNTERTQGNPTFNLKISPNTSEYVNIVYNSGWPGGEIILWH
jgi:hypothetical protein